MTPMKSELMMAEWMNHLRRTSTQQVIGDARPGAVRQSSYRGRLPKKSVSPIVSSYFRHRDSVTI